MNSLNESNYLTKVKTLKSLNALQNYVSRSDCVAKMILETFAL
jgi:hypothetical protein